MAYKKRRPLFHLGPFWGPSDHFWIPLNAPNGLCFFMLDWVNVPDFIFSRLTLPSFYIFPIGLISLFPFSRLALFPHFIFSILFPHFIFSRLKLAGIYISISTLEYSSPMISNSNCICNQFRDCFLYPFRKKGPDFFRPLYFSKFYFKLLVCEWNRETRAGGVNPPTWVT